MLLLLLGSFALIIGFVKTPSIQYYTGGAVVGLFMLGLFIIFGNAMMETRRMEEKLKKEEEAAKSAAPAQPQSS